MMFQNIRMPKNIPRPKEIFSGPSGIALGAWAASSVAAAIVPLTIWGNNRRTYYNYYGKYIAYEQQQQQYEEQGNGNYQNYGNPCSWWNWSCRKQYYNYQQYQQNQDQDENGIYFPTWYKFLGGKMQGDDREGEEEMGMQESATHRFLYVWTLIMFIGLFLYGSQSLYKGNDRTGLIVALVLFGNFCLLNLVTVTQGAIETEGRAMENSVYGWYGQWGVLIAYTDFWIMLHAFLFASIFGAQSWLDHKAASDLEAEAQLASTESISTEYSKSELVANAAANQRISMGAYNHMA